MPAYLCDDGNAEVKIDADTPTEAAEAYVRGGDYGEGPSWVIVYVQEIDETTREEIDDRYRVRVTVEADEPSCTESEHDWQSPYEILGGLRENPGVIGHGGGVIIEEVCMHCGCARTTDTWAQDRATGEQGLESVSYEPGKYGAEVDALRAVELGEGQR